jgi:deoxyribonuclease-1-like protein
MSLKKNLVRTKIINSNFLLTILLLFFTLDCLGGIKVVSWNLRDFGKSKSDDEINYIANTIRAFDVIAIQEVVAGYGGAQAVARLADALNRKGANWEYAISNPTISSSYKTERYAFIWQAHKVSIVGEAWLENRYAMEMDREPFLATFKVLDDYFTLVNFHAITQSKQPEREIKYLKYFKDEYPKLNLIFCGDFNCPQSHSVFIPLKKMGYQPIFTGQKTSLKRKCSESNCLSSEFDNIFYDAHVLQMAKSSVIHFYLDFIDLTQALFISDHLPIWFEFIFK